MRYKFFGDMPVPDASVTKSIAFHKKSVTHFGSADLNKNAVSEGVNTLSLNDQPLRNAFHDTRHTRTCPGAPLNAPAPSPSDVVGGWKAVPPSAEEPALPKSKDEHLGDSLYSGTIYTTTTGRGRRPCTRACLNFRRCPDAVRASGATST